MNKLKVAIHTTDSKEAQPYQFRSSTNVLLEKELVPVAVATDRDKMDAFLSARLGTGPETR